jgi:transposase
MDRLPKDDQFLILLHKKIMNKTGSARRRAKKYYMDRYKKTGVIPKPLLLAAEGIMEGRKASGRKRALDEQVKKRFRQMVKASSDQDDPDFIFITQRARKIKSYHHFLQQEFNKKICLSALRRMVKEENLRIYLDKPDFEQAPALPYAFKQESVFDLVQMDGCVLCYLKIINDAGLFEKPVLIETFDTGSRYMFDLNAYFCESSKNAVDVISRFLLSTPFAQKKIRLRPDNASGFRNLLRVIRSINTAHSVPDGFHLQADFARVAMAKDKAHLESSHRSLHNFEIRIIKAFEKKIVKTEPGYLFKNGKKVKITVTCLNIGLGELRQSGLIEQYRRAHNESKHFFSVDGLTQCWIPAQRFETYQSAAQTISFSAEHVKDLVQYGFKKVKATVSAKGVITFGNRKYIVVVGAEKFSRNHGTKVAVSHVDDKLLIFEHRDDGMLIGEAIAQKPYEKPTQGAVAKLKENQVELMCRFLAANGMVVDRTWLIESYRKGLSLAMVKTVYDQNKQRYDNYCRKLRQPAHITGTALFNAFMLDCERHQRKASYQAS